MGKLAVLRLLIAAVPERANEIEQIWREIDFGVEVAKDSGKLTINANSKRIQFTPRSLEMVWLLAFNGWKALEIYCPAVLGADMFGLPIQQFLDSDDERGPLEQEFRARIRIAMDWIEKEDDGTQWPDDVPRPNSDIDKFDVVTKAAFDLTLIATAYVFLHELRHVIYAAKGDRPSDGFEEEASCDVWARAFMTEKIGDYAESSGQPFDLILQKRSMALALGATIVLIATPPIDRFGSSQYPPSADRLSAMICGRGPSADSHYWTFAACLLVGFYRFEMRPLPLRASSEKELVELLVDGLR